jgi:diadenosine tetraphosphatase ApaH/serine/threonine PP2A family protein phosphatase
MRFLILSDLHSNLEALESALTAASSWGYDRTLVLGDIVGYGADPNPVVAILRRLPGLVSIRGNHDRVAASLEEPEGFNDAARLSALWTRQALTEDNRAFLAALPPGPLEFAPGKLLCHGTPLDEDAYLMDEAEARRCFDGARFDLCLFGHSHHPGAFVLEGSRISRRPAVEENPVIDILPGRRYLVNPGSVGQPRDRNPRAGFAIYDDTSDTVSIHRVAYPVAETREKILRAGLPRWLGDRLLLGA